MLRKESNKVVSFVQHPSEDGDEGDPRWISRWTRLPTLPCHNYLFMHWISYLILKT